MQKKIGENIQKSIDKIEEPCYNQINNPPRGAIKIQSQFGIELRPKGKKVTKIEWLDKHGLIEDFCKYVESQERK